ncbi:GLPGLI family protein [uncultured Chryseobacterium sp.]|uniref:GLPGLI family protein n=1 Tax=uncultured Chryseobacterium sp. TaxID=259322 RepID=UPI0025FB4A62|nr:GLPGLI family protein [uncultured Chryseobacterium sp.]
MKKTLFLLIFTFSHLLFSQNNTFIYDMKYKPCQEKDSLQMQNMILDVSDSKSIFRSSEDKDSDSILYSTKKITDYPVGFDNQFYIIKDLAKKKITKLIQNNTDTYTINIEEIMEWEIDPEVVKIGDYSCQKAIVNYGGRQWTAFFTSQIPILDGPYIFHGLPGLIVKLYDTNKNYDFSLIQVKNGNSDLYDVRSKKNLNINWVKFEKLSKQYYFDPYAEMKSNSASGRKVVFRDENGKVIDPDFKGWTRTRQNEIKSCNNPIEINHKINY